MHLKTLHFQNLGRVFTFTTQYEKPAPPPDPVTKFSSNPVGSLSQGTSQVPRRDDASNEEGSRYGRYDYKVGSVNTEKNVGNGNAPVNHRFAGDTMKVQEPVAVVDGPAAESYHRRHEITVSGSNVPHPFISFESTGLPSEI